MANKIKYQNKLKMKDAEKARDAITASQKKEIAKLPADLTKAAPWPGRNSML